MLDVSGESPIRFRLRRFVGEQRPLHAVALPHARPSGTAQERHVIENMDVDANLSIDFLKDHDIFHASESIFVTRLKISGTFGANAYGICPYPEGNKRLETLAGTFYSDSKSLQPCVYPCSLAQLKVAMRSPISRPVQLRNAGAGGRPEIRKP